MPLLDLFDNPIWQRWAMTLVHFLWQGTAIVVLLALAIRLMGIRTAQGRYAAHLAALVVLALCPLVTFALIDPLPRVITTQPLPASQVSNSPDALHIGRGETIELPVAPVVSAPAVAHELPAPRVSQAAISSYLAAAQPWIVSFWMLGVMLLSLRLITGHFFLRRLRAARIEPPREVARIVARLAAAMGLSPPPALHGCPLINQPAAAGILRPIILVPASWLTQMPTEMLEAVIAHELAHIRRFDLWANLFQRIVETVLFFHPATWWLCARIRAEREVCCDEIAVAVTREKLVYVNTLEFIARTRLTRLQPALAVHMGGSHMALLQRVTHVLGRTSPAAVQSTRSWLSGMAALAVPVVLAGSSLFITTAGAEEEREKPQPPRDREKPREVERDRPREGDGERRPEGDRPREERPVNPERIAARRQAETRLAVLNSAVKESEAHLEEARAQVENAQRQMDRVAKLRKEGVVSEREADEAETNLRVSRARVQAAESRLQNTRAMRATAEAHLKEVLAEGGDRPREGNRPPEGVRRDGDRPDAVRREGDRPDAVRRDGDRPDVVRRDGDRPREGDRPAAVREGARAEQEELIAIVRELRAEVERLRREVNELRGQRGEPRREGDRPAVREGGDRPPVRDGERREPERREGERREGGDRPPVREGEREGVRRDGPPPLPPRGEGEGDRPRPR